MDESRVEINMFASGIESTNPENKLVFKRPETKMQDEHSAKAAPGKITFDIKKGNHVNFKQRVEEEEYDQIDTQPVESIIVAKRDSSLKAVPHQKSVYDLYSSMMPKQDENFKSIFLQNFHKNTN